MSIPGASLPQQGSPMFVAEAGKLQATRPWAMLFWWPRWLLMDPGLVHEGQPVLAEAKNVERFVAS